MRTRLIPVVMVVLTATVALGAAIFIAGCGDSPVGTYDFSTGEDTWKGITLEVKDDGTFVLKGDSETMGNVEIQGKCAIDGNKVTLTMSGDGGSTESEVGTYADGELKFEDITWVKQ